MIDIQIIFNFSQQKNTWDEEQSVWLHEQPVKCALMLWGDLRWTDISVS